ncbi:hypothetical protein PWT90_04787 [Aphanocladium album]|nr:hypothetical protein PWT90_04787 [Aphanocladium album]
MTDTRPMDQFQAADTLLKYIYSGAIGATKGLAVDYAIMRKTDKTFTFSAALEPLDHVPAFLVRSKIKIDRQAGEPSTPQKIEITDEEMRKAVAARNRPPIYIVELRFHDNVASMDAFLKFVHANNPPGAIPIPVVYSIPSEAENQRVTGFGRQITEFVPVIMAERVYPKISHAERLHIVCKMALAWQACWDLPLPSPPQIGALIATDRNGSISLTVGPDRHYSLGGPFTSVRVWLKARLRQSVSSLARASGIDAYKERDMAPIQSFIDIRLDQMPQTIEEGPITALHVDMGLHNAIVSEEGHKEIKVIIDWELCASAPFLALYSCLEMLFRGGAPNGFGKEYLQADELRSAFWDAIPKWKAHWESHAAKDCMEWFRFCSLSASSTLPQGEVAGGEVGVLGREL